jgi:hypothetical protein
MLKLNTMRDLWGVFGDEIALKVASMETIQLSTKIKKKDIVLGAFGAKLIRKFNKAYWTMTPEECVEILRIVETCQEYEQKLDMAGFGGCVAMSLLDTLKSEGIYVANNQ